MEYGDHAVVLRKQRRDDKNDLWQLVIGSEVVADQVAGSRVYGEREERTAFAKLVAKLLERL
jgi:hypothetical protein